MADTPSGQAHPRVLVISHDVVGSCMAGPGIRYWEMAHVLSARQQVMLIAPWPIDLQSTSFTTGSYTWGDAASLASWLRDADVVVANGFVLMAHPEVGQLTRPLALDLYDPIPLENLELFRTAPNEQRLAQNRQDTALLARQLAAGDFFLCATERQRDLYIGALMAAGRVTPTRVDRDPLLRDLIDVVPFGLPAEPPIKQHAALRGVVPGIGASDSIVLWTGGLWDWLDPLTLVHAMRRVVVRHPNTRLVFLAGQHPGSVPSMRAPQEAQRLASSYGLLGSHIFFHEQWVPYQQRADFLLEADIAVSLHHNHLETAYAAVRSRFLDHLWAGLPSVVSDGDAAAELVRQHGLGYVVPVADADALATAIVTLLDDPDERQQCATRARQLAPAWQWATTLQPLVRWIESLSERGDRGQKAEGSRDESVSTVSIQNPKSKIQNPTLDSLFALVQQMEQMWQLQLSATPTSTRLPQLRQIVRAAIQQASAPVYHQQTQFNGLVVHLLYWLSEEMQRIDRDRSALQELVAAHDQTRTMLEESAAAHQRTQAVVRQVQHRVADGEMASTLLAQEVSKLQRDNSR